MSSLWATGRVAPALMGALCILLPACGPPGQGEETSAQQPQVRLQAPPASPGDTDPRAEKALGKIVEGKFTGARAILAAVLADHPGSFRCRFLEAFSWQRQKRYEKARQGFEEVLRSRAVFPGSENILHFHGWALYHLGRLREAEVAFNRHAESAPEAAATWFGLGLIAIEDDRLSEAESFLVRARDLQGRNSRAKIEFAKTVARLGEVYDLQGRHELARENFEEAIRTWPRHYNAHYKLSRVLLRLGDREASQEALRKHQATGKRTTTAGEDP